MTRRSAGYTFLLAVAAFSGFSCEDKEPSPTASAKPALSVAPKPPMPAKSAAAAAGPQQLCDRVCERSRELKCWNADECVANCMASAATPPCADKFLAFFACVAEQPAKNWECDEGGMAAIREGFCEAEQDQTLRCVESKIH
jgi:hypothetical protein